MTKIRTGPQHQLNALAAYLKARREIILNKWHMVCARDLDLNSQIQLSREAFNDHVPMLLHILNQRLNSEQENMDTADIAHEHGLHRWHSGYSLSELVTELELFFNVLLDEVDIYNQNSDTLSADALSQLHRQIYRLSAESVRGSVLYYDRLRQTSASEQANGLQHALDQLRKLGKQRSEHLQHSSHDIRSGFSALMAATQLLEMPSTDSDRAELLEMVNKGLSSIHGMLMQLSDFARIEAGQETLTTKKFDVSTLIRDTVDMARPIAMQRGLILEAEGQQQLEITSDALQLQRLLQNLLHNAIKYTPSGSVYVSWVQQNQLCWTLSVQDTGPGFSADSPAAILASQSRPKVLPAASHVESEVETESLPVSEPLKKKRNYQMKESEGLGLFIVKKICELLKATMDIESAPGEGTLIRIRFLLHQPSGKILNHDN